MAKTLDELRAEYPEQIAYAENAARASADHTEAVNAAIQAERVRMQEIDEVSGSLNAEIVREAKYGDKPRTAAELLLEAAKAAAKQGKKFLSDLKDDGEKSGTADVGAAPGGEDKDPDGEDNEGKTPEARMANARSMVSDLLGKKKEG